MDEYKSDGERIYYLWDKYAREVDVDGLLSLYTSVAVLETPVITAIFDTDEGFVRGQSELRHFFEEGGRRRPNELVRWHRKPDQFLYDGQRLVWEYPRKAPDGNQIEIAEFMDLSEVKTGSGSVLDKLDLDNESQVHLTRSCNPRPCSPNTPASCAGCNASPASAPAPDRATSDSALPLHPDDCRHNPYTLPTDA